MIPERAALLDAGRVFLNRWTDWLEAHPEADEAVVREAMAAGEPPPKEARPNGRPTKLTDETHAIIISAIRAGAYYEDAANVAGVSYDTLNNWRKRGAVESERRKGRVKEGTAVWEKEEPYFQFFEACKKAEGNALVGWLGKIEDATSEHWQAAAWKAERRYPERYGRQRFEHTGANGQPIETAAKIDLSGVSDDELYDALTGAMGQLIAPETRRAGEYGAGTGDAGEAAGADAAAGSQEGGAA